MPLALVFELEFFVIFYLQGLSGGSTTTDREPTDREQTDCEQRRLAEKGDPKYIFTIPRAILPKPSLCDKVTATESVTKTCNEIIASRSVCCSQLTWLAVWLYVH